VYAPGVVIDATVIAPAESDTTVMSAVLETEVADAAAARLLGVMRSLHVRGTVSSDAAALAWQARVLRYPLCVSLSRSLWWSAHSHLGKK
jgi:hypothetical protein